jgi:N-acetylglucosaminyldiphosphoundecaprenol N-acetyl-beta-D-mannosaminyltransferase
VQIHRLTMPQAVEAVMQMLSGTGHHQVVTLNATMLYRATRDEGFRRLVNSASLVTADGMGTMLVARILGTSLPEKVSGVDLVDRLCAGCAKAGVRLFFFGAGPGIAEVAAAKLSAKYPDLQIAGLQHGYYDPLQEPAMIKAVRSAGAQLLLVALGSPRQENWISRHLRESGATVGIGIGGALDVYAGRARLAPEWVRRAGLEWAYRLAREPRRWRVVLTLPLVLLLALRERLSSMLRMVFGKKGN